MFTPYFEKALHLEVLVHTKISKFSFPSYLRTPCQIVHLRNKSNVHLDNLKSTSRILFFFASAIPSVGYDNIELLLNSPNQNQRRLKAVIAAKEQFWIYLKWSLGLILVWVCSGLGSVLGWVALTTTILLAKSPLGFVREHSGYSGEYNVITTDTRDEWKMKINLSWKKFSFHYLIEPLISKSLEREL